MKRYWQFVCGLLFSSSLFAQSLLPFKKGDRVVFVGNSITDGGHYHSYIWMYYITRFPEMRIDVFNAGIGGDIAAQINARIETDVLPHKPTVVAVTFGMNDTGYGEYLREGADEFANKRVATCSTSYALIEKKLQAMTGARKILMASSPYDETSRIKTRAFVGKNAAMLRIADFQQESVTQNKWEFIDFNRSMTAINQREQQKDTLFTICGQDRIHPSNDGHLVMAYLFLKQQGLAGKPVANFRVNAANGKLMQASNCRISNIRSTKDKVEFDYIANALPYPLDTIARGGSGGMNPRRQADAIAFIPFMEEFNQEILRVDGLTANADYTITIDSVVIGSWNGEALSKGINLAAISSTPQYQQAMALLYINEERWEMERRLREYYWMHYSILSRRGLLFNDSERVMDSVRLYAKRDPFVRGVIRTYEKGRLPAVRQSWVLQTEAMADRLYQLNKPVTRRIRIVQKT